MMNTFDQIKTQAALEKIPSMTQDGLFYCEHLIISQSIRTVLEIGTGHGIWSIHMALACSNLKITSLELLEKRVKIALMNVSQLGLDHRINIIHCDALNYTPNETYDLILIDGPKSQNKVLFERYLPYLNPKGYVLVDNMNFHGETKNEGLTQSRDLKQMVRKINAFNDWAHHQSDLSVQSLELGDGLMLISRKY